MRGVRESRMCPLTYNGYEHALLFFCYRVLIVFSANFFGLLHQLNELFSIAILVLPFSSLGKADYLIIRSALFKGILDALQTPSIVLLPHDTVKALNHPNKEKVEKNSGMQKGLNRCFSAIFVFFRRSGQLFYRDQEAHPLTSVFKTDPRSVEWCCVSTIQGLYALHTHDLMLKSLRPWSEDGGVFCACCTL